MGSLEFLQRRMTLGDDNLETQGIYIRRTETFENSWRDNGASAFAVDDQDSLLRRDPKLENSTAIGRDSKKKAWWGGFPKVK